VKGLIVANQQLLRGAISRCPVRLPPADRRHSRQGPTLSPLKPELGTGSRDDGTDTFLRHFDIRYVLRPPAGVSTKA
jgi:hypothetical protein